MERYIIPFDFQSQSYYVFIAKHPGSKTFDITQLVPEPGEKLEREIPLEMVRSFVYPLSPTKMSLQQTIIGCLATYLQQRGWPIDESLSRSD